MNYNGAATAWDFNSGEEYSGCLESLVAMVPEYPDYEGPYLQISLFDARDTTQKTTECVFLVDGEAFGNVQNDIAEFLSSVIGECGSPINAEILVRGALVNDDVRTNLCAYQTVEDIMAQAALMLRFNSSLCPTEPGL